MTGDPILSLRGAALGYGTRVVLEDLDFEVARGSFVGIVGPNGSGKTTLLRAAIGLLQPLRGRVERGTGAGGRPLRIGYVPQRTRLDPIFPFRVRDVVMMGRYPHIGPLRRPSAIDHHSVEEACATVFVVDLLDRPFRDLSGGQQQRTLIARALASDPDLLVLDEPTNGMDLISETGIMRVISRLHRERGATILLVTHLLHLVANDTTDLALVPARHDGQDAGFQFAPREQILSEATLSAFYGMPIVVREVEGQRVILPRGGAS